MIPLFAIILMASLLLSNMDEKKPAIKDEKVILDEWNIPYAPGKGKFWPVASSNKNLDVKARSFHASREKEKRFHAGIDLYADPGNAIIAMDDGIVLSFPTGYVGLDSIVIQHGNITVLYGEILRDKSIKIGDKVSAGQVIGTAAKSKGKSPDAVESTMLHLETWDVNHPPNKFNPWYQTNPAPAGLLDPTMYLIRTRDNV